MRLNRLEIAGFKSFPDRADLHFDRGVTAIVGPNGCGKSNVVDAITWVLGEQSAKSLRGERMEDVIFNGSDARKPTGAAEVRLRLADVPTLPARQAAARAEALPGEAAAEEAQLPLPATEVRDVEIARRLYRSGESEYLIDGEVVRLRDVQDLLMDGGLGVRGYAVIEQGKIGQILSARPTDRRSLIEEAAGVTKYKSRRRAAELKLDAAQQNLARVEDVIFELDRQRASLKRQAARARRYRRLREQLRRWEQVLFARRYRTLSLAIDAARARLADARQQEARALSALAEAEDALRTARSALASAEAKASRAREVSHASELDAERRQQQLAFDRQQIEALTDTLDRLDVEIDALTARQAPIGADLEARRLAAREADATRDSAARDLAKEEATLAEAQHQAQVAEGELDDVRRQAFANATTITTLRNVIDRARETAERLAGEASRLEAEARDQALERDRMIAERTRLTESLRQVQAEIEQTRAARAAHEDVLAGARRDREQRRHVLRELEREVAALEARARSLEELEASREGYGEAARAILADPSFGIPHLGSVADAVEAHPAYERAVEACFGDLLRYVIVASTEDARRGLDLVRSRNLGRCGFLVTAGDVPTEAPVPRPPRGCRPLSDGLRVAGPHAALITAALGEAWLADSFEAAAAASCETPSPVVSSAGDVFRHGRLVAGGSRAESRGLLAIKRELRDLRERIVAGQAAVSAASAALAAVEQGIVEAEHTAGRLAAEFHDHEKAAIGLEVQAGRASADLERIERRLSLIATERQRADQERREHLARGEEATAAVRHHESLAREFDSRLDAAVQRVARLRAEAVAASARVSEAKAAHAALAERAVALANEVQRLEESASELQQRLAARRDERAHAVEKRSDLQRAVAEGTARLAEDQRALDQARASVEQADAEVARCAARVQQAEQTAREARQLLDEVRGGLAQLDVARVTAESDLAHLAEACQDTLQLSLDEVAAAVEAFGEAVPDSAAVLADEETADAALDEEVEATAEHAVRDDEVEAPGRLAAAAGPRALTPEEAIAELRAKIDRLGAINMMAIEQFDELEQRHGFLTAQRQDLVDAIAQTGEAIRKIDKTTRERFREAFTAISRYFEETFQTLFGGGRAGLVLIDESDLLESGIDIVAQPPGKRLQNVQLLSGGEKALTAMALMFAIFKYRPSPFCLLDEIDAPLDDANIGRFIEMLRGMQDRTQFILVTHNRKTMEIADRLYGITMEEPGVSKLISLRLN